MISIRPLQPEEWQALKSIRLKALQNSPGVYGGTYEDALQRSDETWQAMLDGKGRCIFGLFDDQKLIGITGIFTIKDDPTGSSAFMGMSFIEPAYRGRGLSMMLYQARIDWALAQPLLKKLTSGHREDNTPSKNAMLKHGFSCTGREMKTWPDGVEAWDLKYELDLEVLRSKRS